MCEVTPYMVSIATKRQRGAFDLNHRCGIYIYMVNASGLLTTEIVTHWKQIEL